MSSATITLVGERPTSWNTFYAGRHWRVRYDEANRVHAVVRAAMTGNEVPFTNPVTITVTALFDNKEKPIDADNIMAKLYIDGLKGWLIKDDNLTYVRSVTTRSSLCRDGAAVVITVEEVSG